MSAVCVAGVGAMLTQRPASVPAAPQADTKVSDGHASAAHAAEGALEAPASRNGFLKPLSDISSVLMIITI